MNKQFFIGLFSALLLLSSNQFLAQSMCFEQDKNYISLGYGIEGLSGRSLFKTYEVKDQFEVKGFGPVLLKFEHGVSEVVGIGLALGYSTTQVKWNDQLAVAGGTSDTVTTYYEYKYQKLTAVLRFNFHLAQSEQWDPYIGFGVGYKSSNWEFNTNDDSFTSLNLPTFPIAMSFSAGCRFYFNEQVGLFVESGIGHGYLQGGLQFKI